MRSAHLDDLGVETLENRQMMAGDVSANVTGGGDLVLNGDNQGNQLVIIATGVSGQYEIQGLENSGTTINGQASIIVNGVNDDMRINLRGGDNAILLTGVAADGTSNDFDVDDIRFSARTGNDLLILQQVNVSGQLRANMSGGSDAVGIKGGRVASVVVRGGGGNDAVVMAEVEVTGRTDINLGTGDDAVLSLLNEYQDDVRIRMGGGNDLSQLRRLRGDQIQPRPVH